MRLIGAVLLIAAAAGFGMIRASQLRQRPVVLHAVCDALAVLKNDIVSRGMTIPDTLAHVSFQCAETIRPFFLTVCLCLKESTDRFSEIWNKGAETLSPYLNHRELETLRELGVHLGKYEVKAQAEALDVCIKALENDARTAFQDSKQFGRLYMGLGLTVGTMLAVALY